MQQRLWRTSLVRNPFVLPKIMPVDAIASSHSIYATTPSFMQQRPPSPLPS
ncbi:MAG: hypothetical protein VB140_10410 [Burkholderia sp.]